MNILSTYSLGTLKDSFVEKWNQPTWFLMTTEQKEDDKIAFKMLFAFKQREEKIFPVEFEVPASWRKETIIYKTERRQKRRNKQKLETSANQRGE